MARHSRDAPSATKTPPALSRADRVYFLIGWKPARLLLRESQAAADGNLKHPADPGHQLDIGAILLLEPVPRTEGTRFIVSRFAPLDTNFHRWAFRLPLSRNCSTRTAQLPGTVGPGLAVWCRRSLDLDSRNRLLARLPAHALGTAARGDDGKEGRQRERRDRDVRIFRDWPPDERKHGG